MLAGWLCIALGIAYGGLIGYLTWSESVSPSAKATLVLRDGRKIPLAQPTLTLPARPSAPATPEGPDPNSHTLPAADEGGPSSLDQLPSANENRVPVAPSAHLPPQRLKIPSIGVDRPVVLSDNEHLPRFRGVGWLRGSAFPGAVGNIVLFGHLDGPYATFERLRELRPGDLFTITTEEGGFTYRVRSSFDTTPDDVAVLAPTGTPTATLITCSGRWDPIARTYSHRLIVIADLAPDVHNAHAGP